MNCCERRFRRLVFSLEGNMSFLRLLRFARSSTLVFVTHFSSEFISTENTKNCLTSCRSVSHEFVVELWSFDSIRFGNYRWTSRKRARYSPPNTLHHHPPKHNQPQTIKPRRCPQLKSLRSN